MQPLNNLNPKNTENTSKCEDWGLTLIAYKKKKSVSGVTMCWILMKCQVRKDWKLIYQGLEGFRDNFEAQTTTDRDVKGKGHHEDTLTFQNKFSSDIKFFSEAAVQKCSYE